MSVECVYCSNPAIKARTIIEDDLAWCFPTNIPIVPGHILIVPRRHVTLFEDLTEDERTAIFSMMGCLKQVLRKLFGAEGFNLAWNESPVAGQSVPHFHLHLLPRKLGDAGIVEYEPRKFLYRPGSREASPEEELQAVAEIIKAAMVE